MILQYEKSLCLLVLYSVGGVPKWLSVPTPSAHQNTFNGFIYPGGDLLVVLDEELRCLYAGK
jgi:hypothetical protein